MQTEHPFCLPRKIPAPSPFPISSYERHSEMSPYDIFPEIFGNDSYEHLIQGTVKYAA